MTRGPPRRYRPGSAARAAIALFIALSTALLGSREARADLQVAADFNVGVPRVPKPSLSTGIGFDGRIGKQLSLGAVHFTPEICGGYMELGSSVGHLLGGLRFAVAAPIAPVLFVHAGYGALKYAAGGGGTSSGGVAHGPAFDGGFALDLRPLSLFGAGIHVAYNSIQVITSSASERAAFAHSSWISLGAHAAIYF